MNLEKINNYPIREHLEAICTQLKASETRFLILTAETAAGKSTVFPLALLDKFDGKIVMTEPRRLAALSVANRLSELDETKCGEKIGYKVHLENKVSENTKLEVVTEAILIRYLQNDASLEGISVVVLDEFHERSIYTDLALAFLKEAMEFRDDLFVVVMSATIDTEKLRNYLGIKTPVVKIPGRQFPVEVFYDGKKSVEEAVIAEVENGSANDDGILVFLPGIADIRRCEKNLRSYFENSYFAEECPEIYVLHSSISLAEQKKIISEQSGVLGEKRSVSPRRGGSTQRSADAGAGAPPKRRIILSSSIAETSLTVPGISCVIDSGLARVNRMNFATGMENLSTEIESEFSAEQRKGRAGRIRAGKCVRLWAENEKRIKEMPPEILRADLASLVLECADRGIYSADGIDWLDKPTDGAWKGVFDLLLLLGLVGKDGRITEKGRAALKLGINVRLACIILAADEKNLSEAENLVLRYGNYASSSAEIKKRFCEDLERRVEKIWRKGTDGKEIWGGSATCAVKNAFCGGKMEATYTGSATSTDGNATYTGSAIAVALKIPLVLYGFPDRLAKRVSEVGVMPAKYQFYSGRSAIIGEKVTYAAENATFTAGNAIYRGGASKTTSATYGGTATRTPGSATYTDSAILGDNSATYTEHANAGGTRAINVAANGTLNVATSITRARNGSQIAPEWIVAPEVLAGDREAIIFDFEEIKNSDLENWLKARAETKVECNFVDGKIIKTENVCYGKIILSSKKIPVGKEDLVNAWMNEVQKKGFESLPCDEKTKRFLQRADFYYQQKNGGFSEITAEQICVDKIDEWLPSFLGNTGKLTEQIVFDGVYWLLDGSKIDKEVPAEMILQNGKKCKISYEIQSSPDDKNKLVMRPVIEIIIQRAFGCTQTPKIMGMKVLLKLLSPANRPLQITDDLEGFWTGAWPEICKEMKGRYPKHDWNYQG